MKFSHRSYRSKWINAALMVLNTFFIHAADVRAAEEGADRNEPLGLSVAAFSEVRHIDHNFDRVLDDTRYLIDERIGKGHGFEFGYRINSRISLSLERSKYDTDHADGVIIETGQRLQAPIFYRYDRLALGLTLHTPLDEGLWLDSSLRWQKVEQGIGGFFVRLDGSSFGLNSGFDDKGWNPELALRKELSNWSASAFAGYDPDAMIRVHNNDITLESQYYLGGDVSYRFTSHLSAGMRLRSGEVSDARVYLRLSI